MNCTKTPSYLRFTTDQLVIGTMILSLAIIATYLERFRESSITFLASSNSSSTTPQCNHVCYFDFARNLLNVVR